MEKEIINNIARDVIKNNYIIKYSSNLLKKDLALLMNVSTSKISYLFRDDLQYPITFEFIEKYCEATHQSVGEILLEITNAVIKYEKQKKE